MKGANKAFMKNKEQWLKDRMIFYNVSGSSGIGTEPGIFEFDLREMERIQDSQGRSMRAYELKGLTEDYKTGKKKHGRDITNKRKIGRSTHPLEAYFLPWGGNKTFTMKLGNRADYFFTPTLNGCTFTVGGGHEVVVAHSNYVKGANQTIDQGRINLDIFNTFGRNVAAILSKQAYKDNLGPNAPIVDFKVTVVGIRKKSGWSFYYQRYQQSLNRGKLVNMALDRRVNLA